MVKVLLVDIETAPNIGYVWSFFKTSLGAKMVLDRSYMLSFAAKWLGKDEVIYCENRWDDEGDMLDVLYGLLDEADIVVAHNGDKFDIPKIKGRGLVNGLTPPSPYKTVDTLKVAKRHFGFTSNSLENLAIELGLTPKLSHKEFPGFELWLECLRQNDKAWNEMRVYNIQDVETLEEMYLRMLPYIDNHPNMNVYTGSEKPACPKCGSGDSHKRGSYYTNVGKYQRFRCNSCGGWHRSRYTESSIESRRALTTNAV